MDTLESKLVALAQAVGADIGALRRSQGDIQELQVPGSTSLVAAANDLLNMIRHIPVPAMAMEYESEEQSIAPGAYIELTHGLGTTPRLLSLTLKSKVADSFGYEVGEEISLDQVYTGISYGTDVGIQSASSATKIRIKVAGAGAAITNMSTGQPGIVDPNNYKLIVRAWA